MVNLSLGDARRPFGGPISPWARLLDYLADRYGILFLVSAGNITEPLRVDGFAGWIEFEDADPERRELAVLMALSNQKALRTLLSPAEALNPVTVGSMHDDAVDAPRGAGSVDPYPRRDLPNVSSALGLGHRKVVKPDLHLPGGREHLRFQGPVVVGFSSYRPRADVRGLKAASPDAAGNLDRMALSMWYQRGHRVGDTLGASDLRSADGTATADRCMRTWRKSFRAVVVKALLVQPDQVGQPRSCS